MTGNEWRTPPELFDQLTTWFVLDYDAAATHDNALCKTYSTIDGTFEDIYGNAKPGSYRARLSNNDGLSEPWAGRRVWINPPYARGEIGRWMAKCYSERNEAAIIVAIVKHDPSTLWWQRNIGLNDEHAIVLPLPRRVRFSGAKAGANFASAIVVWRKDIA